MSTIDKFNSASRRSGDAAPNPVLAGIGLVAAGGVIAPMIAAGIAGGSIATTGIMAAFAMGAAALIGMMAFAPFAATATDTRDTYVPAAIAGVTTVAMMVAAASYLYANPIGVSQPDTQNVDSFDRPPAAAALDPAGHHYRAPAAIGHSSDAPPVYVAARPAPSFAP